MAEYNPLRKMAKKIVYGAFDVAMTVQDTPRERYKFYAIGNSHLDAAWKWRKLQTMSKAKFTFKNALKNMANYEEYIFSQSTPQYYEWMKERHPRIFRAIQDQVKGRHWEIVGGMWVEPDCNLPDGESLVRHRLYGQRFYLNNFGRFSEIAWLPDTFGFCWTLPQILKKSGARYFWTTKLLWNDTTRFPFSTFMWRGPDGSEILTHISPLMGLSLLNMHKFKKTHRLVRYHDELVANYNTRPGDIIAKMSRDYIPDIGIFYGIGDGGGGPLEVEIEAVRALKDKGYLDITRAIDYFQALEPSRERLPVWDDELYLEFHRGVYTTQAAAKAANRRAEIAMRNVEIIHCMNSLFGEPYPGDAIRDHWKTVLFNQFHDILPGSSIPEVYEDAHEEYDSMFLSVYEMIQKGIVSIARRIHTENQEMASSTPLIVYNTTSWQRTSTALLRLKKREEEVSVFDTAGNELPSQVIDLAGHRTLAFSAEEIPNLGYKTYYLKPTPPAELEFTPMAREDDDGNIILSNEMIRAEINGGTGLLTSLLLKEDGEELLAAPSHAFRLYNDDSKIYPAWDIEKNYQKKEIELRGPSELPEIIENGPVVATVKYVQPLRDSTATVRIRIFRKRPIILYNVTVDWRETKALLKVDFNTSVNAENVVCDIPYGAIARPTAPRYPAQKARWEMPCQKWIDMSDGERGVALLNQDKYGFSAHGGTMALTLLRGAKYPKPIRGAWGLRPSEERPEYTDQGTHVMRYAVMPHRGDWREAKLWSAGHELNDTLLSVRTDHHRGLLPGVGTSLECKSNTSYVSAIKRPEDASGSPDRKYHQIVVRIVEAAGRQDTVTLSFGAIMTITDVKETDLIEFSTKPITDVSEGRVEIQMKPFEIKTVKITLIDNVMRDRESKTSER